MTRPMPGPPEHRMDAHPHGDNGWCPICHHLTARRPYDSARHLSDAECAAEFWSATARAQFFAWAPNHLLGIDTHADGNPCHTTRPDPYPHWDEAETWRRFATHPHAFKENHNDRP